MSLAVHIKKLQDNYHKNIERIKKEIKLKEKSDDNQSTEEYILNALTEAEKVWLNIKVLKATNNEQFSKLNDEEKINLLRKDFTEFYNEFPIVSRYMICLESYNSKAFKKMLIKCKNTTFNNKKETNEEIWIQRQADYVKYLWEESQTKRFTTKESNEVWNAAYKALSEEFKHFKNLHSEMEEKVKKDNSKYKLELIKEMGGRIVNGQQSLDTYDMKELVNILKDKLYRQRYKNVVKEINDTVKYIETTCYGIGKNEQARKDHDEEMKQNATKSKYKITL